MKTAIALVLLLIAGACHADQESCRAARGQAHHAGLNWHVLVTAKSGKVSILGPFTWKRAEWIRATLLGEPATKEQCDAADEAQKKAEQWDADFEKKLIADLQKMAIAKCSVSKWGQWYQVGYVNVMACRGADGKVNMLNYIYTGTLNPYQGAYSAPDSLVSSAVLFQ